MFWAPGHEQLNVDIFFIYIRYAPPPYSARISIWYASLVGLRLPFATPSSEAHHRIYGV